MNLFKKLFMSEENNNISTDNVEKVDNVDVESTNSTTTSNNVENEVVNAEVNPEVNEVVNPVNDANDGISVIPVDEFNTRLKEAISKHMPEEGINDKREAQAFVQYVGRQINNYFPDMPTMKVVSLLGLMFEGKYQNDKMLTLIEEMPIGGYGY